MAIGDMVLCGAEMADSLMELFQARATVGPFQPTRQARRYARASGRSLARRRRLVASRVFEIRIDPVQIITVLRGIGVARRNNFAQHFVFPGLLVGQALPGCRWSFLCSHDLPESSLLPAESERLRCGESSKSEETNILQQPLPQYALHPGQPSWGSRLERRAALLLQYPPIHREKRYLLKQFLPAFRHLRIAALALRSTASDTTKLYFSRSVSRHLRVITCRPAVTASRLGLAAG